MKAKLQSVLRTGYGVDLYQSTFMAGWLSIYRGHWRSRTYGVQIVRSILNSNPIMLVDVGNLPYSLMFIVHVKSSGEIYNDPVVWFLLELSFECMIRNKRNHSASTEYSVIWQIFHEYGVPRVVKFPAGYFVTSVESKSHRIAKREYLGAWTLLWFIASLFIVITLC